MLLFSFTREYIIFLGFTYNTNYFDLHVYKTFLKLFDKEKGDDIIIKESKNKIHDRNIFI